MALEPRSTKRRRVSSGPEPIFITAPGDSLAPRLENGPPMFTRHADFWLDDGNLIILAGNTGFRVYKGLLVKKSGFFSNMFATGPSNTTKTLDGCSVVRLSDHPEDLADFLQYLMPCSDLQLRDEQPVSDFSQLHAAIHLAHKYQCPDVKTRVLSVLKRYYTSNFMVYAAQFSTSKVSPSLLHPPREAAIAAVNVARLTSTPSMLPFALYLACLLGGEIIDGYARRNGSIEYLSPDDLRVCIDARTDLAKQLAILIQTVFRAEHGVSTAGCTTMEKCFKARGDLHEEMEMNRQGDCDVLDPDDEMIEVDPDLGWVYRQATMMDEVKTRKFVWMLLPSIFGLSVGECGFTDGDDLS